MWAMDERASQPRVSVALATCDGADYLDAQLQSLLDQRRRPDELIVADDASRDGTAQIVEAFRRRAPFPVRILENAERLGVTCNFEAALEACTGEIVFLADQDDVWFADRIGVVLEAFRQNPDVELVLNDLLITDRRLQPTGETYFQRHRRGGARPDYWVTGCATAFRRSLLEAMLPIPGSATGHDHWIHMVARARGSRMLLDRVLQYYRRHAGNASSGRAGTPRRMSMLEEFTRLPSEQAHRQYAGRERMVEAALERDSILAGLDDEAVAGARARLVEELMAVRRRRQAVERGGPAQAMAALGMWIRGDYRQFSGWRSCLRDVASAMVRRPGAGE